MVHGKPMQVTFGIGDGALPALAGLEPGDQVNPTGAPPTPGESAPSASKGRSQNFRYLYDWSFEIRCVKGTRDLAGFRLQSGDLRVEREFPSPYLSKFVGRVQEEFTHEPIIVVPMMSPMPGLQGA
jgi:hypothetical protein